MIAPPLRCRCGAGPIATLFGDPRVPIYACGSTPRDQVCRPARAPVDRNVVELDAADVLALGDLMADVIVSRVAPGERVPVVGLCDYVIERTVDGGEYRCGSTAVDGRCLRHA